MYKKANGFFNIFFIFTRRTVVSFWHRWFQRIRGFRNKKRLFFIYLDEKNILPRDYDSNEFESKGFYERALIQDFPIRGKAVYLGIRRRRWRNKTDKSIEVKSDYSFIAEGSKLTVELSAFLKGTGRDPRRYDK